MIQFSLNPSDMVLRKQLVNIRIMGHLLKVGPTDKAKSHISTTINSEATDEALIARGAFYDNSQGEGSYPPRRPLITRALRSDRLWQKCINSFGVIHPTIKKRRKAYNLLRPWLVTIIDVSCPAPWTRSHSSSTTNSKHGYRKGWHHEPPKDYAANAWTIIEHFGFPKILQELEGEKIHRLENVLTLEYDLHDHFDDLTLWLEPTDIENRYKVCTTKERYIFELLKVPRFVDFTSTRSDFPLPSSEKYLNLVEDDDPFKSKVRSYDPVGSDFGDVLAARLYDVSEIRLAATVGA
ncbi:uncharacterized protein EV420DRAFT_1747063 [Desarmillaria tabescens]|uniref:HNH nuclease domain-containing protein n=1 Tax=Armillaria tabescens TaxID=1929756 RepID=A0AA39KFJ5_ARMTA|nr:uncharacterized protein EV420DRAFT_1747063 [Desarmillaria tabescens]KAK0460092.1 hypothetical protein EV420DRAFT_1747063 [Desarmillaria tabescens]